MIGTSFLPLVCQERSRHEKQECLYLHFSELSELKNLWTGGAITQRSIHSSKGLEADFVIVADLMAEHHGFPSEIQDDPILNLVLSDEDSFKDSEERRLLYVALTRSKHQTHLVADASCPSRFAEELANGKYQVTIKILLLDNREATITYSLSGFTAGYNKLSSSVTN